MTAAPEIVVTEAPDPRDREAIMRPLLVSGDAEIGAKPLAVLLRDPETGETTGGLWAKSIHAWFYVELLFVPEHLRGQGVGARLMRRAESEATARGCAGVWLDTFGYQAGGFYERLGYEAFGGMANPPNSGARYFLKRTS